MWAMRWRVPWRRFHFSSVPQKLKDSYKAQVEAGGLEKDGLQERVVGYLSQALEKALQREQHQPSNTRDGSGQELGFAGHPGWVLPLETIGGSSGSGAAEEHRRAAEWTAKLAAENRRRLAKGTQAKVLPAATGISQVETQRTAEPASEAQEAPPKREPLKSSVYLHGPVGTGKTMLMNLFHDHSQQAGLRTSRQHFYEFMISLHQQIQKDAAERPVEVAANRWADDLDVLCFDEFQITDIQDAVILPRLFEVLFLRGVTVVMTSNTAPQLLYTGGLNRHVHLPAFVRLVAEHSTVLGLGAKSVDYRRRAEANMESDFDAFLVGDLGAELFESKWRECVGQAPVESVTLTLPMGRYLDVPQVAGSACRLGFQELCAGDRGEADFYALADRFQTVFLSGVPKFTSLEDTDVVRRFVKLLDLLYDRRIKVVLSSAVPLEELFDAIRDEVKGDMSDLAWRTAQYSADGKAGLSPQAVGTLCEAIRASERAESRLREMRTRQYWQSCE